jgi:hypothetical protein
LWSNFDSLQRAPKRMSKKFKVIFLQNWNFVEETRLACLLEQHHSLT